MARIEEDISREFPCAGKLKIEILRLGKAGEVKMAPNRAKSVGGS